MSGRLIDAEKFRGFIESTWVRAMLFPEQKSPDGRTVYEHVTALIELEIESGRLDAQSPTPGQDGQWILVSERLPEHKEKVLVAWPDGLIDVAQMLSGRLHASACVRLAERVTHWMPLPPSPTSTGERE